MKKAEWKRPVSILTAILLTVTFCTSTYASESGTNDKKPDQEISFKSIDQVPDGIIPIIFYSNEEAINYIKQMQCSFDSSHSIADPYNSNFNSLISSTITTSIGRASSAKYIGGSTWLNMAIPCHSTMNPSRIFADGQPYSWISGLTIGMVWTQDQGVYRSIDGGRTLYVKVYGHLDFYLVLNGGLLLYTYNWDFGDTYGPSDIR